jgi:hypothetical protein
MPAWFGLLPPQPVLGCAAHEGEVGLSAAATQTLPLLPEKRALPPVPLIKLDSSGDEDDAAWEACHLAMARRKSLTTVVIGMW